MDNDLASAPKAQAIEFEAMNLQVGVRLQFITHRGIKPVQHFSALIGYVKDEYLIVKIPLESGLPIALADGEKLTIRVFSGVTVCSFACTVLRVFPRPLSYAHLSFPVTIQGICLRGAMRVKVHIPAQITGTDPQAVPDKVILVNLSVSGALVESPRKLPPGQDIVTLQFSLLAHPGSQLVTMSTRASIKNVHVVRPAGELHEVFTYGVQFIDLDPAYYSLLQNMTYEALIAHREKIV